MTENHSVASYANYRQPFYDKLMNCDAYIAPDARKTD